jgi:uncharacterized protein (DUF1499 family)
MPQMNFNTSVGAGASVNQVQGWEYEYLPFPAHVRILLTSTATGQLLTVKSGSETICSDMPVSVNATANVYPSEFAITPIDFNAAAGDKLQVTVRNTTGGALVPYGTVIVNPIA